MQDRLYRKIGLCREASFSYRVPALYEHLGSLEVIIVIDKCTSTTCVFARPYTYSLNSCSLASPAAAHAAGD